MIAAQIKEPIHTNSPPVTRPHTANNESLWEIIELLFRGVNKVVNKPKGERTENKEGKKMERNMKILRNQETEQDGGKHMVRMLKG